MEVRHHEIAGVGVVEIHVRQGLDTDDQRVVVLDLEVEDAYRFSLGTNPAYPHRRPITVVGQHEVAGVGVEEIHVRHGLATDDQRIAVLDLEVPRLPRRQSSPVMKTSFLHASTFLAPHLPS